MNKMSKRASHYFHDPQHAIYDQRPSEALGDESEEKLFPGFSTKKQEVAFKPSGYEVQPSFEYDRCHDEPQEYARGDAAYLDDTSPIAHYDCRSIVCSDSPIQIGDEPTRQEHHPIPRPHAIIPIGAAAHVCRRYERIEID